MIIIIDSKIPYKSIYEYETTFEVDLDKLHSFDGEIEDKVLAVYKLYVEHRADLVVLTDMELVDALQLEGVHVCYAKQGEING